MDKLETPSEPKEVRSFILAVRSRLGSSPDIDWDSFAVWAGNRIPQYLWACWKIKLRKTGFTWQKFLRLMKYRTKDAILWVYEKMHWEHFVNKVIESIEGPLGRAIVER